MPMSECCGFRQLKQKRREDTSCGSGRSWTT